MSRQTTGPTGSWEQTTIWTFFLYAVVFFMVVRLPTVEMTEVNCFMDEDILQQQKACFNMEGINISLPSSSSKATEEQRKADLLTTLLDNEPEMVCRHKEGFKRALPCVMEHARRCIPTHYQGFLPDPDRMPGTVDRLCSNQSVVNFNCVKDMQERLYDCALLKGQETFRDVREDIAAKTVLCKTFEFHIVCQKEVLPDCGCETTRAYTDIFIDFIYPPSCPSIGLVHGHVMCDVNGDVITYNSLAVHGANRHHPNNAGISHQSFYLHCCCCLHNTLVIVSILSITFLRELYGVLK